MFGFDTGRAGHDRHAGHSIEMFRDRFWVCLSLTVPILLYSPGLWDLVKAPHPPGGDLVPFVLGTASA